MPHTNPLAFAAPWFEPDGKAPDMGHHFLALDPGPTSGGAFGARMAALAAAVDRDVVRQGRLALIRGPRWQIW
jgi:hypothetical protein